MEIQHSLRKQFSRSEWLILIILLSIFLTVSIYCLKRFYVRNILSSSTVVRLSSLETESLPVYLQEIFSNIDGQQLLLVRINKAKITYYINEPNTADRAKIVVQAIKMITDSMLHKIADGDYLFTLHDGVNLYDKPVPILGFAGHAKLVNNNRAILIPDFEALSGYKNSFAQLDRHFNDYYWPNKISKIFWRGSATGIRSNNQQVYTGDRLQFVSDFAKLNFVDAGFTNYTQQYNQEYIQELKSNYKLKTPVNTVNSLAYKYLIDIDGNSCTYSRMAWILYSSSLLMKHKSNNLQWYYDRLQPYVHYIPIAEDFSDLQEQFEWAEAHPFKAQQIAFNGHLLARKIFSESAVLQALEQGLMKYHAIIAMQV